MQDRLITSRFNSIKKSVLLIGPRQVGKTTLIDQCMPDLSINLAREDEFLAFSRDPSRIRQILHGSPRAKLISIDEIQRVPKLLNEVQDLIDHNKKLRFLLSGSSARKLKDLGVNLLPGRIVREYLDPLTVFEVGKIDLDRALQIGTLPGIYLDTISGTKILETYAEVYLREEIREQALVKDIGMYARFLDVAAIVSGQWLNYSKIASDTEIPKETVRRYMQLLEDTLIIHRLESFHPRNKITRRVIQRDKILFFDVGVRNALIGLTRGKLTSDQRGILFEQWFLLQVIAINRALDKGWKISSYLTAGGAEVDIVLETPDEIIGIEIKSGKSVHASWLAGLRSLESFVGTYKPLRKWVAYTGDRRLLEKEGVIIHPYLDCLKELKNR